ncbi:TonB-dependent receptor [bacterium]|nr:TonB-dependent receptor [bacterium]MBU1883933.1 TonB-dependent receptor [bacterium]
MKKNIKISLILASLISTLYAQSTIVLEPLSVDSTAIKTDELKSTDAVEVYTADEIEKAHVQNIYEFLNKSSSVFATSAYGNPFVQKIDMRGYGVGSGYQNIVVTLNGRKMNNVDMVPQLLASISPSSIDKIEIIKSSGIVSGGDGANAGVINITTRKDNTKEISFYGGTYGSADAAFYVGSSDEKLSLSLNGEVQKNDGIRDIDSNGNKDKNKFSTFNFSLSYLPVSELELRLNATTTNTDVIYASYLNKDEYDSNPYQKGDTNWGATHQTYKSDALSLGTTYFINDNLSLNLDTSTEKKQSDYITYSSVYDYDYKSAKISLDYANDLYSVVLGLDGFDGSAAKRSSTIDLTKQNQAAFVMSQFYLDKLTLKAGYRYEKINFNVNNADNVNDYMYGAELGANYLLDASQSLFANFSRSFESASLDRLFSFSTGAYGGYVKPSKANSYELGYNNIDKTNKFKISAYYVNLEDEIYYYAGVSYVGAKNTNIDKSHKYGIDLYDKFVIDDALSVALNYNYVQAIIDREKIGSFDYSGNKLPGVSDHNVKATLSYLPNGTTTFTVTQTYRSEAYAAEDFNNDLNQKQDAYMSTDIAATYAKKTWELFVKINNLFNQKNGIWINDDAIYPVNFTTTATAGLKLKY